MTSLDGKIREGLRSFVAANVTGAKKVVTYQSGAFREEDLPAVLLDLGQWTQVMGGHGNIPGQRAFFRSYAVGFACIADTKRADYAETVNALADQVQACLSRWEQIPDLAVMDLSIQSASYDRFDSGKGSQGMLVLEGTLDVVVNEAFPDVAQGDDAPVSAFPLQLGAF